MLFLVRAKSAAEGAQRVRQSIARFTQPGAPPPKFQNGRSSSLT